MWMGCIRSDWVSKHPHLKGSAHLFEVVGLAHVSQMRHMRAMRTDLRPQMTISIARARMFRAKNWDRNDKWTHISHRNSPKPIEKKNKTNIMNKHKQNNYEQMKPSWMHKKSHLVVFQISTSQACKDWNAKNVGAACSGFAPAPGWTWQPGAGIDRKFGLQQQRHSWWGLF